MAFAVSFIPVAGPLISCIIDGTFVDMFSAIMKGDWAMVGMCALAFAPGGKALKGLKAVESFSGKGQKFIRYMGEKEYSKALQTGIIKSQGGKTFVTKNFFSDATSMTKKLNKPNAADRHFIEFRVKNEVTVYGAHKVESEEGRWTGAWEYWLGPDDQFEIEILSHGVLP